MDKASMLYNKFKTMFLVGEGDSVLSQVLNKSLAEQRQFEEAKKGALKKAEQAKEQSIGEEATRQPCQGHYTTALSRALHYSPVKGITLQPCQ